jgi:hypothetical protein
LISNGNFLLEEGVEVIALRRGRLVEKLESPFQAEEPITLMFKPERELGGGEPQSGPQPGMKKSLQLEDVQLLSETYTVT